MLNVTRVKRIFRWFNFYYFSLVHYESSPLVNNIHIVHLYLSHRNIWHLKIYRMILAQQIKLRWLPHSLALSPSTPEDIVQFPRPRIAGLKIVVESLLFRYTDMINDSSRVDTLLQKRTQYVTMQEDSGASPHSYPINHSLHSLKSPSRWVTVFQHCALTRA